MIGYILTAIGLIIAIIGLYWQITKDRPKLGVFPQLETKSLTQVSQVAGGLSPEDVLTFTIHLSNSTIHAIAVKKIFLSIGPNFKIDVPEFHLLGWPTPPVVVEAHRETEYVASADELAALIQKHTLEPEVTATVYVQDETGNQFKSKPMRLSIVELRSAPPARKVRVT